MTRRSLILIFPFVLFGLLAFADETVRPGDTAPKILSRAGVTVEWLWDFMEVNNLTLEDLHNLQVGNTMIIREEWKDALPEPEFEKASMVMLQASKYKTLYIWNAAAVKERDDLRNQIGERDLRISELTIQLESKQEEIASLKSGWAVERKGYVDQIKELTRQRDELKGRLRNLQLEFAKLESQKTPMWTWFVIVGMVLIFGLMIYGLWRFKEKNKSFQKEYTDPWGVVWKLRDGGYECPWGCKELVPFGERQVHGRSVHPERFQEVIVERREAMGIKMKEAN